MSTRSYWGIANTTKAVTSEMTSTAADAKNHRVVLRYSISASSSSRIARSSVISCSSMATTRLTAAKSDLYDHLPGASNPQKRKNARVNPSSTVIAVMIPSRYPEGSGDSSRISVHSLRRSHGGSLIRDVVELRVGQLERQRVEIGFQMAERQRTGNREHRRRTLQQPGEHHLLRRRVVAIGGFLHCAPRVGAKWVIRNEDNLLARAVVDDDVVPPFVEVVLVLHRRDRH